MQSFSTPLLSNILRAILTHIDQTPDVPRHHPGLVEFTRTLRQYNARLNDHTPPPQLQSRDGKPLPTTELNRYVSGHSR